jgi:Ca2+:H+ antiporter
LVVLTSLAIPVLPLLIGAALVGSVLAAVHHAEVVAHKVGEPFGSFLLAIAVTVIELGLIITLMAAAAGYRSHWGWTPKVRCCCS